MTSPQPFSIGNALFPKFFRIRRYNHPRRNRGARRYETGNAAQASASIDIPTSVPTGQCVIA